MSPSFVSVGAKDTVPPGLMVPVAVAPVRLSSTYRFFNVVESLADFHKNPAAYAATATNARRMSISIIWLDLFRLLNHVRRDRFLSSMSSSPVGLWYESEHFLVYFYCLG